MEVVGRGDDCKVDQERIIVLVQMTSGAYGPKVYIW